MHALCHRNKVHHFWAWLSLGTPEAADRICETGRTSASVVAEARTSVAVIYAGNCDFGL